MSKVFVADEIQLNLVNKVAILEPFQWPRGYPLNSDCPKSFHFGDYVEANDRSVGGFVRGYMGTGNDKHGFYLIQVHEDGDIIPMISGALQLVLRTNTLEDMTIAYKAYKENL